MADSKRKGPDELLSDQAEKDREEVLVDTVASRDRLAAESGNRELEGADRLVNTEKTLPHERASFSRRTLVTNHTIAGLPADVHQALVSSSQLRRNEAMAYREVQAVLSKYADSAHEMPDEVFQHLDEELSALEEAAKFDERARVLLEKYT